MANPPKQPRAARKTATQKKQPSTQPAAKNNPPAAIPNNIPVVGIGASAGGLGAFKMLLSHLPKDTGMAFVLIQHLDPKHKSMLTELLAKDCPLPIQEVTDGMVMERNNVYVIPPNQHLTLLHNYLHFMPEDGGGRRYNPVDTFFRSLAEDRGNKAIGVVLSGTASDGTRGSRAIKEAGGIIFAQDRESAEYDGMPTNVVANGCVDFILPPEEIARELGHIAHHPMLQLNIPIRKTDELLAATSDQLNKIFILLRTRTTRDFSYYKSTTIKRRINRRMLVHKIDRVAQYIQLLQRDVQEVDALFHDILINVTSFFRDPESTDALQHIAFPKILENLQPNEPMRIWVPACSSGEEAYSIAIALHECFGDRNTPVQAQIFGSDIDETAIKKARNGIYPESIVDEISPVRLKRYFHQVSGGYRVSKVLRDMCVFAVQDVTKDPPFSRLDLVSCRNLLIYLESILQNKLIQLFHYALQPGGFLLLGTSETIGNQAGLFALKDKRAKLYQKKSVAARKWVEGLILQPAQENPAANIVHQGEGQAKVYNLEKEAERMLMEHYVPPGVIVNPDQAVLLFIGRTWPYIEPSAGTASLNLYKIAHPDLIMELRAAIHSVTKNGGTACKKNICLRVDGTAWWTNIQVLSLGGSIIGENNLLVMFEPRPALPEKVPGPTDDSTSQLADQLQARNAELERELATTRDYMQSIVEEQEGTNEELHSANEEVQSANEELHSTNEELETAKEELQSANEELATVNEELENRNQELAYTNNDLTNLMASVNLPILMLSSDLCIRQFTQPAEKLLNLISADLGRPIGNIKPNIEIPNLEAEVLEVIDSMSIRILELQDRQGHWYTVRIRPYKTLDNHIEGAVITFIDIDQIRDVPHLKETLAKERRLAAVVRDSSDAITMQDLEGNILAWNPAAERIYGYREQEALEMNIEAIVSQQDRPKLLQMLQDIREGRSVGPMELEHNAKDGRVLQVRVVVSTLVDGQGKPIALATTEQVLNR